jgi:hypothetical protein
VTEQTALTEQAAPEPSGVPRTSRNRATVIVTLGLSATGLVVGGLWAWIAPSIHAVVAITRAGERVHDYLGSESQNFFVAPVMLLGLLSVVAVVAPVLVWQWREHRGPGMVVALSIGLVGAAAAAAGVGALLVLMRYGVLDFDAVPIVGDRGITYVVQAPPVFFARKPLQVVATLAWPAGVAALVYAVLASGSAHDDLVGDPPAGRPSNPPTVEPEAPGTPEAPEAPEAKVS